MAQEKQIKYKGVFYLMFTITNEKEVQSCILPNTLVLGDCLEIMKYIPSGSIDLVLCDPPYGTTACKWDSVIPLEPMWEQLKRIIKPNGAIVLFSCQPFTSALVASNYKMYRYEWIWEKNKTTGFLNSKKMPLRKHENILIFSHKSTVYNPQMSVGHKPVNSYTKHTSDGDTVGKTKIGISGGGSTERYPTTVLKYNVVNQDGTSDGGRFHPSQKPIDLLKYLIRTYSNENETVLDFCMGSGSTGVACVDTNRKFIGIEKEDIYFDISSKRII